MAIKLDLRRLEAIKSTDHFKILKDKALKYAKEIENDNSIGFTHLPETSRYIEDAETISLKLPDGIDTLLVLGIGGSALGTKMIANCFGEHLKRRLIVLDNVDPDTVKSISKKINPQKTCINVISKSGSTVEPISLFKYFFNLFRENLGEVEALKRTVITTDPEKGNLRKLATSFNILTLEVPQNVGGRFSVLTPVGIFPLYYAGVDVSSILRGALKQKKEGVEQAITGSIVDYMFYTGGKNIKVMFIYSDRLYTFGEWYLQLFAESLGKKVKKNGEEIRIGATGVLAKGVTDQHSQVQLYKEGPDDKLFVFFRLEKKHDVIIPPAFDQDKGFSYLTGKTFGELMFAECEGTIQALENDGRPVILYEMDEITPENMGRLIYLFELQTAVAGFLYGIDPFNQPGVEEGKTIAKKLLGYN